jgi:uncharacterized protein YukE
MANGNTTYDYGVIEQCNAMIRAKVSSLQSRADTFTDDSTALVNQFWGGETADRYALQAKDIINDLGSLTDTLSQIGKRVDDSAMRMIETDMKGAKSFDAV